MSKKFHFILTNGLNKEFLQITNISVSSSHFYFIIQRKTRICLLSLPIVHKRYMLSPRHCLSVARSAYHCLNTLTNTDTCNKTTKNNQQVLVNGLVDLGLDHNKGALQHKASILNHMTTHKFPANNFYTAYKDIYPDSKVVSEPDSTCTVRVINEITVVHEYQTTFYNDIEKIHATMDMVPSNFHAQKQNNPDFLSYIYTIDGGIRKAIKCVPQDEKSGMDMFKHSTSGNLGLLTYDKQTGESVQIMQEKITLLDLIVKDQENLRAIGQAMDFDMLRRKAFSNTVQELTSFLKESNTQCSVDIHNQYQQSLWDSFQRHPDYNRSISFIFIKEVEYSPLTDAEGAFAQNFKGLLGNNIYKLDRKQHCMDVYKAMLLAYKNNVDPEVLSKLSYLHNEAGIVMNKHFLMHIATLMKTGQI
jgi:hypothetical protein